MNYCKKKSLHTYTIVPNLKKQFKLEGIYKIKMG